MLKKTDLHVHLLQCLYPEDLFSLAKDCYRDINWNRFTFLDRYQKIFKKRIDPIKIFDRAIETNSIEEIKKVATYRYHPGGNFDEFDITSFFPLCITGYYFDKLDFVSVLKPIVERHKKEGLKYVEYRQGVGFSNYEEWKDWNVRFARFLKESSTDSFQAKYIMRISEGLYPYVIQMLKETPDIRDVVVGVDFTGREVDPERLKAFYKKVKEDQEKDPDCSVEVVVHIGETFYDKSLESAIRWCHQSALLGAKRLAHCIALGIEPKVALARQKNAHLLETVQDRINQINYDLTFKDELISFGIKVDEASLKEELMELKERPKDELIRREYDEERIEDIKKRQDFVLEDFKRLETVIETCPTSNLCIGGIPSIQDHPFIKLLQSGVNLAICTDDPGIFDQSLSDEIDFIIENFNISKNELEKRLGDPYRFRLKNK